MYKDTQPFPSIVKMQFFRMVLLSCFKKELLLSAETKKFYQENICMLKLYNLTRKAKDI